LSEAICNRTDRLKQGVLNASYYPVVPHLLHLTHLPQLGRLPVQRTLSRHTMSEFVHISARSPPQSISEVLAPGIIGLFVQGLVTGLIITQLSRWLYLERTDSVAVNVLVVFVTTIGL
jgi:hypothetical protein